MSKSDLLTFKSAALPQGQSAAPTPINPDECGFSGQPCHKGSLGRECLLASRIFCDTWSNPEDYKVCTFVRREAMYKEKEVF
jgi:hypothetical protein